MAELTLPNNPMWTTTQAIAFIRELHPHAYAAGWNLHLGGGLATTKDTSEKDADILLMPRVQTDHHDQDAVCKALQQRGWAAVDQCNIPHRRIITFTKNGRVAELIFVKIP